MSTWMKSLAVAGVVASVMCGSAQAADPSGTYLRDSGASRVRIAKCGDAYCGSIVWLKDANGPAKVGQRVFYDMKADGENKWAGKAFNPEDGKVYSGRHDALRQHTHHQGLRGRRLDLQERELVKGELRRADHPQ